MPDTLGRIHVKFVIDCTGSMAPYIDAAKAHARSEAERISGEGDLDMRFSVVAYRDHPPQDNSFAARHFGTGDYTALEDALRPLTAEGGGDGPESVWDGVDMAIDGEWYEGADRLVILIGDSPPHGYRRGGDGFPQGCPCGRTATKLVAKLEASRIRLHAHSIAGDTYTTAAFNEVALPSGGEVTVVDSPMASVHSYATTLTATSGSVGMGREYMAAAAASPSSSMADLADQLGWDKATTESTVSYLRTRGVSAPGTDSAAPFRSTTSASGAPTPDTSAAAPDLGASVTSTGSSRKTRSRGTSSRSGAKSPLLGE